MLSKFHVLKVSSSLILRRNTHLLKPELVNRLYGLLCNPLCTLIESPELPGWVKFSENGNNVSVDSDDEFVIPELASWVENHKLDYSNKVGKHVLSEVTDDGVDKIGKILKNGFSSPDDVVQSLSGCGVILSNSLIAQLLKRFSNEWIPAFGLFKWAEAQMGYKHSPELYNLMVDILGKSKKFHLLWELVEEMHQLEGYVTLVTFCKIMRRYAKAGKYKDAIEAFRGMSRFGVEREAEAMNVLMNALVKESSIELAHEVFLEFKNCIPVSSYTFNILIHGWCKVRKFDDARKAMEEMERHGFHPDVISYTNFIEAYSREKDFRKVDATLDEMEEKGCKPNVVTYTIVMHGLGKARQINEALEVYERMKRHGCVPDTAFYSSMIYILGKAGRLKDASNVFEDMPKQGIKPDILTYNTMIGSACDYHQEETALKLLKKMEEDSCKPDIKTYDPLLKMCCKKKRMKVLYFLLSHMFKNDIGLEHGTYTLLIVGLCKSGKLEHACLFFEEMVLKGLVPRDSTCKLLVKKLEEMSMEKAKQQIENLMSKAKEL